VQLHTALERDRLEVDRALPVAQRVVDQVAERLAQARRVGAHHKAVGYRDGDQPLAAVLHVARPDRLEHVGHRDVLRVEGQLVALGARHQEQIVDQARQALRLVDGGADSAGELRARGAVARDELELGPEHRQRRAQLVAGVGGEAALALEAVLEPREHLVEGRAETMELVVPTAERQALVQAIA
jgi:hypothetical protein